MGLFSVLIKFHLVGHSPSNDLVTFVNREAADEWWRTISAPSSVYAKCIKRISPRFYIQTEFIVDEYAYDFFNKGESPGTRHLSERMFSGGTTTNVPNEVDHISGRWYFIRSKAEPCSYWYLRTRGTCVVCADTKCSAIHASSEHRTRFCIRVRSDSQVPEDFVMIGTDKISISAPKDHILHINDAEDLVGTKGYQGETDLLFSDLKKRFITRAERQVNGEVWEYVESVERGVGEPWELVE